MGQLLKLWWMAFWRMWLFASFLNVVNLLVIATLSFIAAFVMRVSYKHSLEIFPMWKLFTRQNPLIDLRPRKRGTRTVRRTPSRPSPTIDREFAPGAYTGYEPQRIENLPIPSSRLMHGKPGAGLSNSGFGSEAIALGQRGEENFAKVLSVALHNNGFPIIEATDSFWSVGMPNKYAADKRDLLYDGDIDCIFVSATTIYLLDLKYYKGGNVSYRSFGDQLMCVDLATGRPNGEKKTMSRNMATAQERFSSLFPNMKVESRVVFMPTERGIPQVEGVYWPGGIPAVGLMGILDELDQVRPASTNRHAKDAANKISHLLKV